MWKNSPQEKLLAALFKSEPITPKHGVPAGLTGDWSAETFGDPIGDRFFSDFDIFPDQLNQLYTANDSWEGGPWRLQELADTLLSRSEDGPRFGRRYSVFYNQANIGIVEINPTYDYDAKINPNVYTHVELEQVRLLPYFEVLGFLVSLLEDTPDAGAQRSIDRAMLAVLWNRNDNDDSPALELFVTNSVANYLHWRSLVLNNRAKAR
jgi:hypothetical protein